MLPNLRKYYRPRSIEATLRLLSANPVRCAVLAGGTHLLASSRRDVEDVVDISALKLKMVKRKNGDVCIGATATLQSILENPRLRKFADGILVEACHRNSVSRMIRNQRTMGGEICANWKRSDLAAVLLALNARVKLMNFSLEEKEMLISDFWSMPAFRAGKKGSGLVFPGLLLELILPTPAPPFAAAFEHVEQIESQPSFVSSAAVLEFGENRQCGEARVALSSFADAPCRLPRLESFLKGKTLTPESVESAAALGFGEIRPLVDSRASGMYRQAVAPVLIRRLLGRCLKGH
ncbi:MAG: FAD binding domain-containing protein [Terriglobia bacterium]